MNAVLKTHWEKVYESKKYEEATWYQEKPETSLEMIAALDLPETAGIIDIGGGDSNLVDHLLEDGYRDISVLDISEKALGHARDRLGEKAEQVSWIAADAASFEPEKQYYLWHDRAALHFLTEDEQVEGYINNLERSVKRGGFVVLATFSENGPTKCSGREIRQYSKEQLSDLLKEKFETLECRNVDHITPSGGKQNFTFCSFRKK
ncbi:class I SAM-dependent methyltransferase [Salegentibacter flavus]|uniref:Methyltransferase domain-containing protein n=1 Tax=Salegentibacter flavus TaxID=287099 RepID=A0A1I5BPV5_9FLAO|nr:class I SAM-dependent methyltransferase [Salegentibacter flavus]SFN76740.1 Methyltransferase domain-containing protein [Salegentibacter flavus]